MRRNVNALVLLTLFALLALFAYPHTGPGTNKVEPAHDAVRQTPAATLDRPATKFDLLFLEPQLTLP